MGKRLVIISATASIAEHCIRLWVNQGQVDDLVVVGRNQEKLQAIIDDAKTRAPNMTCELKVITDFRDETNIQSLVTSIAKKPIDIALVAQGMMPCQQSSQQNLTCLRESIEINVLSVAFFAEALAMQMTAQGYGTLGVIGSVAGDRARRRNYHYGSAKAMVNAFTEGLQHRFASTPINICLIKPGPTRTPMTEHMANQSMASAAAVAKIIVKDMAKGKRIIYAPKHWRLIMWLVRHMPWFLFKRIDV